MDRRRSVVEVGKRQIVQSHDAHYTVKDTSSIYAILYFVLGVGAVIFVLILIKLIHSTYCKKHDSKCECLSCTEDQKELQVVIERRETADASKIRRDRNRSETGPFLQVPIESEPASATETIDVATVIHEQSHNVPDTRVPIPSQSALSEDDHDPPPLPKKRILPKDPMEVIHLIFQEVLALVDEVKQFTGNSRTDKDYIYLDEMLTRNLIKLDIVEPNGRDDVREARRECIKLILGTISQLEDKVPLPEKNAEDLEIFPVSKEASSDNDPAKFSTSGSSLLTPIEAEPGSSSSLPSGSSSPENNDRTPPLIPNLIEVTAMVNNHNEEENSEDTSDLVYDLLSLTMSPDEPGWKQHILEPIQEEAT